MVKKVVALARHFVDPVDVDRIQRMRFRDGERGRAAIDLASAGEDNFNLRVMNAAGLEDGELGLTVDLQIRHGVCHRIEVTGLPGKVKQVVLALDEVPQAMGVADIGDIHLNAVPDWFDVEKASAVIRNQAVNDRNSGAQSDQAKREV